MAETLVEKTCTPCRGGIPPLTREEAERLHSQAPQWELLDDAHRIARSFRFRNFREALNFVDSVSELPRRKAIILTSISAGATRLSRCARRRSKDFTRTISSWLPRS